MGHRWVGLAVALAFAVAAAGCGGARGAAATGGQAAGDNALDPDTVAVGDQVGAFTVAEVGEHRPGVNVRPNLRAALTGEAQVTASYVVIGDTGRHAGLVQLTAFDPGSLARLPRLAGDPEPAGLLFAWPGQARELFGPPGSTGRATVTLGHYVMVRYPGTSSPDQAEVLAVLDIKPDH